MGKIIEWIKKIFTRKRKAVQGEKKQKPKPQDKKD